jgi:DNA-binding IclR family transcriptional regulator
MRKKLNAGFVEIYEHPFYLSLILVAKDFTMGSTSAARLTTLERGVKMFELIVEKQSVTVTEVAKAFSITKSTAHRFLATWKSLGYLQQNAKNEYFLTDRIKSVAQGRVPKFEVKQLVRPFLEELLKIFRETVNLGHWEGIEVSYLDQLTSKDILNPDLHIGARIPAYCTAMGKAILAHLPEIELKQYITRVKLEPHTERTITDPRVLTEQLSVIRLNGYAVMDEELVIGLRGAAAPVFNKRGYPQYALSVGAWSFRMSDETLKLVSREVKRVASEASAYLLLNQDTDD